MMNIKVADITLREEGKNYSLSFKEKIEVAKILDKLCVDVIETAPITNGKTDILFLHSIAPIVKNSCISCPTGLDEESVKIAFDAIKEAKHPRLHIMAPVSTVQMEYLCHKKPKAMIEFIEKIVSFAKSLTDDVEISLIDATRAEKEFLYEAVKTSIKSGVTTVTICDQAGEMLPSEYKEFLNDVIENVPEIKDVTLSAECSNSLDMASACAVACIKCGAGQIKTVSVSDVCTDLSAFAHILKVKADALSVKTKINMPVLDDSVSKIINMAAQTRKRTILDEALPTASEKIVLSENDDITALSKAVKKLGYELSEDDLDNVYAEFVKLSKSKAVGKKEIDAIVASVAMQVAPTYKLKGYVINNSNLISSSAHIELLKDGEVYQGISIGDGPIDAAFLAIEQITGHHFELDDFQIQSVTEGREAMGSSIVKLRNNNKPYSGKGISTDIIGASINAYINALNKICFEEDNV